LTILCACGDAYEMSTLAWSSKKGFSSHYYLSYHSDKHNQSNTS
jgi:hypothetical protein